MAGQNTTKRMKRTSQLYTETVTTRHSGAPSVSSISKSINTAMPWMRTHRLFASILHTQGLPRSDLISGACTKVATTKLGMLSTPTRGLQSSTGKWCNCSTTAFAQALAGHGRAATRCSCSARCSSHCVCKRSLYIGSWWTSAFTHQPQRAS